ncbi:hypothetical protein [Clostridium sp. DMHC 10]|nr:hypothetical protein [Clostridium sp. DMHC 10]
MKKLIEEKKNKGLKKGLREKAHKSIGGKQKGFNNKKSGGLFDK